MSKSKELLESYDKIKIAHDVVALMRTHNPSRSYFEVHTPRSNGNTVEIDTRHWGDWEVPPGEDDDGDYDWEELTDKSSKKLDEIISLAKKKYPSSTIRIVSSEKNYLTVKVS